MDYSSAEMMAERWKTNVRVVQRLCAQGRVAGARKMGREWLIPSDAQKPLDSRKLRGSSGGGACPIPYGVPNPLLSQFFSTPGTADEIVSSLDNEEAHSLCAALLAYYRGRNREAEILANRLLEKDPCFEAQVGCALVLATCSLYSGSVVNWMRAQDLLHGLRLQRPESSAVSVVEAALSGVLYVREAPTWLQKGRLLGFPTVSYPSLWYIYAKWLLLEKRYDGLLATIEPLIASVHAIGSVLSELYLHIIAAVAYKLTDDNRLCCEHIEMALDLALPDELYGALAEYRRQLGKPLDEALKRRDPNAFNAVRSTYERIAAGFTALHNAITGNELSNELTLREHEIATLAKKGESNAVIADRLGITVGSVKAYLSVIYQKLHVCNRNDLKKYIL